jgi:hypothetical protein
MVGAFLGRMSVKWDQATCRHDYHWAFSKNRTFLRCTKCKHETPGWDLTDTKRPSLRYPGDPDRFRSK